MNAPATGPVDGRWGPYPLVLAGAVLAVAYAVLLDPYWGAFALGAVLTLGALARLTGGGRLAVRRTATDTITLAVLGIALMAAAIVLEYPDLMPRP
ncbi:hypothetical protein FHS43_000819 [Streptosporangium becharense]|uniref:DUF3017 domain-containing protein n=1 Tax=Streptosporangium becharense TaxID=1816182 RepID=A0A7W9IFP3_9ACTN|nr:DUF3017 domain-containing protein [Streptosporangium becharense]MBB2909573.1 hypothetical protein [Streptosporangium becharense]MBB5819471.1 hypothetical protein [Streptosporangium becharense]